MTSPFPRRTVSVLAALGATFSSLVAFAPAAEAGTSCPTPRSGIIRSAPGSGKTVALTFDDGPADSTPEILAILHEHKVRATFFNTGAHDARYPEKTRQIAAEGHLVANHTYEHEYPSSKNSHWSRSYLNGQFDKTNSKQKELTGRRTCFFRPPGGYVTSGMVAEARANKMTTVMWSVDTQDWKQASRTTKASTEMIKKNARAGYSQAHPIVLMHTGKASHESEKKVSSNRSNDVAALASIIEGYQDRGYRFVDMNGSSGLGDAPTTLTLQTASATVDAGFGLTAISATVETLAGPVSGKNVQ